MLNEDENENATMVLIHAKICSMKANNQYILHLTLNQRDLLVEKLPELLTLSDSELLKLDTLERKIGKETDLEISKGKARFLALELLILSLKLDKNQEYGFTFTNDNDFQEHYVITRDL